MSKTPGHVSPSESSFLDDLVSDASSRIIDAAAPAQRERGDNSLNIGDVAAMLGTGASGATYASTAGIGRPSDYEIAQERYGDVTPPSERIPASRSSARSASMPIGSTVVGTTAAVAPVSAAASPIGQTASQGSVLVAPVTDASAEAARQAAALNPQVLADVDSAVTSPAAASAIAESETSGSRRRRGRQKQENRNLLSDEDSARLKSLIADVSSAPEEAAAAVVDNQEQAPEVRTEDQSTAEETDDNEQQQNAQAQAQANPVSEPENISPEEDGEEFVPSNWYTYNVGEPVTREDRGKSDDERIREYVRDNAADIPITDVYENAYDVEGDIGAVSPQEFARDFEAGETGDGKYDPMPPEPTISMRQSVARIVRFFHEAFVPLESQRIDEDGNIRFDPVTEQAINVYMVQMGYRPEERYLVFQQVIKALGFSPDRNGKFMNEDYYKIPDRVFRNALSNMYRSCLVYGHPYGFIDKGMVLGGTRCYPIGVMNMHEAEIMCREGGIFAGQNPIDLVNKAASTWINETLPDIRRDVYNQRNGYSQMIMLEDMVRAFASLDSITPRKYGISETVDRGYEIFYAEMEMKLGKDESDEETNAQLRKQIEMKRAREREAANKLDRRRNRLKYTWKEDVTDDAGNIIHRKGERVRSKDIPELQNMDEGERQLLVDEQRNSKANPFTAACHFTANLARFMGVVGYAPIMGSSILEHAQGNINTIIANKILFGKSPDYAPTDAMYDKMMSEGGLEAIAAFKALWSAGGADAALAFYNEYKVLNRTNVGLFLNQFVNRESNFTGKAAELAHKVSSRVDEWTRYLMPGDLGFAKADAKRWLEGFMISNMMYAKDKSGRFEHYTASEVLEMMDAMGIERFMAAATSMQAGREAMVMMRNQTLDRYSPLTYQTDKIMKRSGVVDAVITLGIDTYFRYGMGLIQNFVPFSNTWSYLITRGINRARTGGIKSDDKSDIDSLNYQMGGLDSFGVGFYKNFIYDVIKLANITAITAFAAAIIAALGFEEPEDELNKYAWQEYRIGKNLALGGYDENGNPHGIPVYAAWWLNDLTLFGLPAAYAINAKGLDQHLVENDPDLPTKLFKQGCYDAICGVGLFDMIRSVKRVEEDLATLDEAMNDPNFKFDGDWGSLAALQVELVVARGAGKFMPNVIKSYMQGDWSFITGEMNFDRTAYETYDRTSKEPGKTKSVEDIYERMRRAESKYNPIYAVYNNLTKNHYLFDDGTTLNTGYLLSEMPIATMKDQRYLNWIDRYSYPDDYDNLPQEDQVVIKAQMAEQIINDFEEKYHGDINRAIADGWFIPWQQRVDLGWYCESNRNMWTNMYNDALQNGITGADKNELWTLKENARSYYKGLLDDVVYGDLDWSDKGYAKIRTNNYTVYQFNDTGKPATWEDWISDPDNVTKKYIPRGDLPNAIAPFTTPYVGDKTGYNYEVKSKWFKEGLTDLESVFNEGLDENGNDIILKLGRDAGVPVNTAIFGGSPNFATDEPISSETYNALNNPTAGYRGYTWWDDEFLKTTPNALGLYGGNGAGAGTVANAANGTTGNGTLPEDAALGSAIEDGKVTNPLSFDFVFDQMKGEIERAVDTPNPLFGDMGLKYDIKNTTSTGGNSYGGSSRSYSYSKSSGSNYNPRIYNTRVSGTHISSTRGSSTHTNPTLRSPNADRAATMYAKAPQDTKVNTYLRPGFETKGSREAYKRQDI